MIKKTILLLLFLLTGCASRLGNLNKQKKYSISSQGAISSTQAARIFEAGGNIYDVAVALSFLLCVERPASTGIGGGGFLLFYHPERMPKPVALDFRERAHGQIDSIDFSNYSGTGVHSVGVPGLVAGLYEIHSRFGKLSWATVLDPAINLARNGFEIYPELARTIDTYRTLLESNTQTKSIFLEASSLKKNKLIQTDLANTLEMIAKNGPKAFYEGDIANKIVKESQKLEGKLTLDDLKNYKPVYRDIVTGSFGKDKQKNRYTIYSMGLPSAGGISVIEILNILQNAQLEARDPLSWENIHKTSMAMYLSYSDRARYLGDPDFHSIKFEHLLTPQYAMEQWNRIPQDKALDQKNFYDNIIPQVNNESNETTHFSIIDSNGEIIVSTQTINGHFGSGIMVAETGILLNNQLSDFSFKDKLKMPHNYIQSHKRPLSSMAPTIIVDNKNHYMMGLGSPGSTRIISCVALSLLNRLYYDLPLQDSIALTRYHIEGPNIQLRIDGPISREIEEKLTQLGYELNHKAGYCAVHAVEGQWNKSWNSTHLEDLSGVSDPRSSGLVVTQ